MLCRRVASRRPLPLLLRFGGGVPAGSRVLRAALLSSSTPQAEGKEEEEEDAQMDKLSSLCKVRGFAFPTGLLYGGLAGFYEFGPLGAQLRKNVRDQWWRRFVELRPDVVGLESPIITNPKGRRERDRYRERETRERGRERSEMRPW